MNSLFPHTDISVEISPHQWFFCETFDDCNESKFIQTLSSGGGMHGSNVMTEHSRNLNIL